MDSKIFYIFAMIAGIIYSVWQITIRVQQQGFSGLSMVIGMLILSIMGLIIFILAKDE
ncbi:hypothetical protein [Litchfieldia alkalitelluris]|uniref:hypothetical protein n=1 Tax=Litchfieldia alkalitelluris TaxID=304268 RepID=UPI00147494D3|nr:hypothetical protein [Litchfieldia alkalitelluris]